MKRFMGSILVLFMLEFVCDADEDVYFGKGPSFAKNKDEIRECFPKNNIRETEIITDNGNLFFVTVTIGSGIARDNVYVYYKNQNGGYYILFIYFVANAKGTTFIYDSDTKIVKLVSYDKQILLTIPVLPVFKYNTTRPVTTLDVQQIKKAVEFNISNYTQLMDYLHKQDDIINKHDIKNRYGAGLILLEGIIAKLTEQNRQNILDEIYVQKIEKSMYAIQAFILYYSKMNNRTMVMNILSNKCPGNIFLTTDIEYFLIKDTGFEHPFHMLIQSYKDSKSAENKANIAKIIRRSLIAMNVTGENDSQLIDNAEKWYETNKTNLSPNPEYVYDKPQKIIFHSVPLFIYKKQ